MMVSDIESDESYAANWLKRRQDSTTDDSDSEFFELLEEIFRSAPQ